MPEDESSDAAESDAPHLEFANRAKRDLKKLPKGERKRLLKALQGLVAVPQASNLDLEPLTGRPRWYRLRVGPWRIIYYRPTDEEQIKLVLQRGVLEGSPVYVVARIANKKDVDRVLKTLEVPELG